MPACSAYVAPKRSSSTLTTDSSLDAIGLQLPQNAPDQPSSHGARLAAVRRRCCRPRPAGTESGCADAPELRTSRVDRFPVVSVPAAAGTLTTPLTAPAGESLPRAGSSHATDVIAGVEFG